jgi:DNA-binding SARP family transcriptional activator
MPVRTAGASGLLVHVDGQTGSPEASGKSAKKLRTLVAVLAAKKSGVTHAQLCDWLWPDAEGDKAAASLKVAIHRARQWLGNDAIRVYDGLVSLNPAIVDCDLWRLAKDGVAEPERLLQGFDEPPIRALRATFRTK